MRIPCLGLIVLAAACSQLPAATPRRIPAAVAVMAAGGGTSNDHFLAAAFATTRLLRLADGPDEVHRSQIGKIELRRHRNTDPNRTGGASQPLTLDEATSWADGGLWPRPKDF